MWEGEAQGEGERALCRLCPEHGAQGRHHDLSLTKSWKFDQLSCAGTLRMPFYMLLFNRVLEDLATVIREETEIKDI